MPAQQSHSQIIPVHSMDPVSKTSSGPHHSGSVMKDVTMPSHFGSLPSTSAIADPNTEARSRQTAAGIINSSGRRAPPPTSTHPYSGQSAAFLSSALSLHQNPPSLVDSFSQMDEECFFANLFASVVGANQSSEHCTGSEPSLGNLFTPETSHGGPKSEPPCNQVGEALQKNPPSIRPNLSAGSPELSRTPALSPSELTSPVKVESPESFADEQLFDCSAFENFANELLKYPSSTASDLSSQFSSPSLSSSSTSHSRSSTSSPYHSSIDSNSFDEAVLSQKSTLDSYYQNCYLIPPAGSLNAGIPSNSVNPMPYAGQLRLETSCPLQYHIQQQQHLLLQNLQLQQSLPQDLLPQQSWTQGLGQQLPEFDSFLNAYNYSDGRSAHFQTTPALKPIFICPKCGKGHTRHSNLLAHLRDTHSQVKKVFCDFPGCTKSYKRVSECRRHKKDLHGIPLPSELNGKVRKPRSTMSSILHPSKYQRF